MKVLDLQCAQQHIFEGWFASENDFQDQLGRGLVACPVCGSVSISKMLSAPRLNLGGGIDPAIVSHEVAAPAGAELSLQSAWIALAQRIVANTEDVGERFVEEARKIHYGEAKERNIRGRASAADTQSLIEEGITVLPLALPEFLKGSLQ